VGEIGRSQARTYLWLRSVALSTPSQSPPLALALLDVLSFLPFPDRPLSTMRPVPGQSSCSSAPTPKAPSFRFPNALLSQIEPPPFAVCRHRHRRLHQSTWRRIAGWYVRDEVVLAVHVKRHQYKYRTEEDGLPSGQVPCNDVNWLLVRYCINAWKQI
jgi:hypothetical protein